jgi:hypothetical protein
VAPLFSGSFFRLEFIYRLFLCPVVRVFVLLLPVRLCVWPCPLIDFMTAATAARAAAVAAAVAAFTAILCTRAAPDLAAPTIVRLVLRLFLAMEMSSGAVP